jgi:hypothetical protein
MTILLQVHDEIFQAIAATLKSVLAKSEVWFRLPASAPVSAQLEHNKPVPTTFCKPGVSASICFCWRARVASYSLDLAMLFDELIKQGRRGRAEIFTAREKSSANSRVTASVPDSSNTRMIAGCEYEKDLA